jgi:hypothetical protein
VAAATARTVGFDRRIGRVNWSRLGNATWLAM